MGGDHGPEAVVPGAALALQRLPGVRFIFYGDEGQIRPILSRYTELREVSEIAHTRDVVPNDEKASVALRTGRDSSMRLAINAVGEGRADCVVSSGNTGAMMAMAKLVLKCLQGIHRPAIASVFPSTRGNTIMLDLGANLTSDSELLIQFAVLGSVYARAVKGISDPSVGLLNVGAEDMKGHEQLRAAANVLGEIEFPGRYYGFVEGNDIPEGTTNVVVTDGFTGNVALKMAEGVGRLTESYMRQAFKSSLAARFGGLLAYKAMKRIKKQMDPRLYNGGMFLGLDGICVKSHGSSDHVAFANAIQVAADLVANGFNKRVAHEIEQVMNQESFFTNELPSDT
jgi:glycerol-3-phosphate acyltransferase PlsX